MHSSFCFNHLTSSLLSFLSTYHSFKLCRVFYAKIFHSSSPILHNTNSVLSLTLPAATEQPCKTRGVGQPGLCGQRGSSWQRISPFVMILVYTFLLRRRMKMIMFDPPPLSSHFCSSHLQVNLEWMQAMFRFWVTSFLLCILLHWLPCFPYRTKGYNVLCFFFFLLLVFLENCF